jgi:flavorubredoxin
MPSRLLLKNGFVLTLDPALGDLPRADVLVEDGKIALGQPLCVPINSAVLTGEEPVIIDTGSPRNRTQWLDDVFSIVEPADVRWVFVSHEDADHTGNLETVMARCPHATLLCSWALVERFSCVYDFPLYRCRWVADGDTVDIGDRQLAVFRPPIFDSPSTLSVFDTRSRMRWATDTFATAIPGTPGSALMHDVRELDQQAWREGMGSHGGSHGQRRDTRSIPPWLALA